MIKGWRNNFTGEQILSGTNTEELSEIAFSGIHIVEPEIFSFMQDGVYTMTSLYLKLAAEHRIYTYRDDEGYWGDIGTPESLESIRKFLGNKR
jgi:NDP-sugar pyrophosphorylase family protein